MIKIKKNGTIKKFINNITQIGNVISLIRCIRTALMDYNSQNVTLLTTYNTNDFYNLLTEFQYNQMTIQRVNHHRYLKI